MKKIVQVRIYKGEKYFVAECVDLPVVSQGRTLDEAAENIRAAIALHLEGEDLAEWDILPDFSILVNLELAKSNTVKKNTTVILKDISYRTCSSDTGAGAGLSFSGGASFSEPKP